MENWNLKKKIAFVPALLLALCLTGYFLLVLAYCIPERLMEPKMRTSVSVFSQEGSYPRLTNHGNAILDNFTDALMLLTASHPKKESVWKSAVHAAYYSADGKNPSETFTYLYQESGAAVYDNPYPRYWHGYLVFLKPLLVFFSYPTIRYIVMFVQLGLFTALVVKLAEENRILVFPVFLSWIFLNPTATMLSLQFNSMLMLAFLAMLFVLRQKERWRDNSYMWGLFFLMVGAAASYLDLLTYPLVTLGFPLVLWLALNDSGSTKENLKRVLVFSAFWTFGYGAMWGCKWILGSVVTGENILANAAGAIRIRASSSAFERDISFLGVILNQLKGSYQVTWPAVVIILAAFLIFQGIRLRKGMLHVLVPCLLISLYPFVWYAALKNHSYIHHWFTYRELAVSLYALTTFAMIYMGGGKSKWIKSLC